MKIHLVNTAGGFLIPMDDSDYEKKKRLKIGETYLVEIKQARNIDFHRKFFAMIAMAYAFLPEHLQQHFHNAEGLRAYVTVAAGYTELFFSPKLMEFVEIPKSIAFDKMEQDEFEDLYNSVRAVLDKILTRFISQEEFEHYFLPF